MDAEIADLERALPVAEQVVDHGLSAFEYIYFCFFIFIIILWVSANS
jgi:hypothetical protein